VSRTDFYSLEKRNFSREIFFALMTHAYNYFARKLFAFPQEISPVESGLYACDIFVKGANRILEACVHVQKHLDLNIGQKHYAIDISKSNAEIIVDWVFLDTPTSWALERTLTLL
jgi:hypothetical protein